MDGWSGVRNQPIFSSFFAQNFLYYEPRDVFLPREKQGTGVRTFDSSRVSPPILLLNLRLPDGKGGNFTSNLISRYRLRPGGGGGGRRGVHSGKLGTKLGGRIRCLQSRDWMARSWPGGPTTTIVKAYTLSHMNKLIVCLFHPVRVQIPPKTCRTTCPFGYVPPHRRSRSDRGMAVRREQKQQCATNVCGSLLPAGIKDSLRPLSLSSPSCPRSNLRQTGGEAVFKHHISI